MGVLVSMIDRYKKYGGFYQLLGLLESSSMAKREKFFKIILDESPVWHDALKQKMLNFSDLLKWPVEILAEVTSRTQPITLAAIAKSLPDDKTKILLSGLNHSQFAKIRGIMNETDFTPEQTQSSIEKLLGETRGLAQQGILKFDKFAPHLHIPDDIESQLEARPYSMPSLPSADILSERATARIVNPPSQGQSLPPQVEEELSALRRQNFQLQMELQNLRKVNAVMKDKLEQIKKIA